MWQMILLQIGLVLLMRWLSSDKDSSAVETKIFNTTDKDEMLELVVGNVVADMLKGEELDTGTKLLIDGLIASSDKDALNELINKPETKVSITDSIGKIINGLFGGIFDK